MVLRSAIGSLVRTSGPLSLNRRSWPSICGNDTRPILHTMHSAGGGILILKERIKKGSNGVKIFILSEIFNIVHGKIGGAARIINHGAKIFYHNPEFYYDAAPQQKKQICPTCMCSSTTHVENKKISHRHILRYITDLIGYRKSEALVALFIGVGNSINGIKIYSNGNENNIQIGIQRLIISASQCNAKRILLAHNHPSGVAKPSLNDIDETIRAQKAALTAGIELIDHLVVSGEDIFSILHNKKVKG